MAASGSPPGNSPFVAFWLPGGLMLAVLLRTSGASWPWFVAAGGLANMAFDLTDGQRPAVALAFAPGIVLEAASSAWLIRRHTGPTVSVERLRDFLTMAVLAGLIGAPLGAVLGAWTTVLAFNQPFFAARGTW